MRQVFYQKLKVLLKEVKRIMLTVNRLLIIRLLTLLCNFYFFVMKLSQFNETVFKKYSKTHKNQSMVEF